MTSTDLETNTLKPHSDYVNFESGLHDITHGKNFRDDVFSHLKHGHITRFEKDIYRIYRKDYRPGRSAAPSHVISGGTDVNTMETDDRQEMLNSG